MEPENSAKMPALEFYLNDPGLAKPENLKTDIIYLSNEPVIHG